MYLVIIVGFVSIVKGNLFFDILLAIIYFKYVGVATIAITELKPHVLETLITVLSENIYFMWSAIVVL